MAIFLYCQIYSS